MESAAEDDEAQLQLVPIVMQQTHEEEMTFVGMDNVSYSVSNSADLGALATDDELNVGQLRADDFCMDCASVFLVQCL